MVVYTIYPDGKTYPAREMIEAFERWQRINPFFNYLVSLNISNTLQI